MFCPNCKATFLCDVDDIFHTENVTVSEASDSEIEVIFDCASCGEQYVVTIAQEDLVPPKRTYTIMEKFLNHAKRLPW